MTAHYDFLRFWDEIVAPNCREANENPSDRRLLYNACITLYALLKDYLEDEPEGSALDLTELETSKEYKAIQAVCNAAKHKVHDRTQHIAGSEPFRPPAIAGLMMTGWSMLGDVDGSFELPAGTIKGVAHSIDLRSAMLALYLAVENGLHLREADTQ